MQQDPELSADHEKRKGTQKLPKYVDMAHIEPADRKQNYNASREQRPSGNGKSEEEQLGESNLQAGVLPRPTRIKITDHIKGSLVIIRRIRENIIVPVRGERLAGAAPHTDFM